MISNNKKIAEQYTLLSQHYDDWFSLQWPEPAYRQGKAIEKIFKNFQLPNNARVLDLTCGIGTQAIGLALQGYEVVALDISDGQLRKAKEEANKIDPNLKIEWILGDATEPKKYVNGTFDAVISFGNSLPLLGNEEAIISCMRQSQTILKSNGLLLVSMRDHSELRKTRPYLMGSGKLNNKDRQGIWIETGEWLQGQNRYISHIIFIMSQPEHKEYHYPFPPLAALTAEETLNLIKQANFDTSTMQRVEDISFPVFIGKK